MSWGHVNLVTLLVLNVMGKVLINALNAKTKKFLMIMDFVLAVIWVNTLFLKLIHAIIVMSFVLIVLVGEEVSTA